MDAVVDVVVVVVPVVVVVAAAVVVVAAMALALVVVVAAGARAERRTCVTPLVPPVYNMEMESTDLPTCSMQLKRSTI